jgi:hypothetical protein
LSVTETAINSARALAAEFIRTFALIFVGAAAAITLGAAHIGNRDRAVSRSNRIAAGNQIPSDRITDHDDLNHRLEESAERADLGKEEALLSEASTSIEEKPERIG